MSRMNFAPGDCVEIDNCPLQKWEYRHSSKVLAYPTRYAVCSYIGPCSPEIPPIKDYRVQIVVEESRLRHFPHPLELLAEQAREESAETGTGDGRINRL